MKKDRIEEFEIKKRELEELNYTFIGESKEKFIFQKEEVHPYEFPYKAIDFFPYDYNIYTFQNNDGEKRYIVTDPNGNLVRPSSLGKLKYNSKKTKEAIVNDRFSSVSFSEREDFVNWETYLLNYANEELGIQIDRGVLMYSFYSNGSWKDNRHPFYLPNEEEIKKAYENTKEKVKDSEFLSFVTREMQGGRERKDHIMRLMFGEDFDFNYGNSGYLDMVVEGLAVPFLKRAIEEVYLEKGRYVQSVDVMKMCGLSEKNERIYFNRLTENKLTKMGIDKNIAEEIISKIASGEKVYNPEVFMRYWETKKIMKNLSELSNELFNEKDFILQYAFSEISDHDKEELKRIAWNNKSTENQVLCNAFINEFNNNKNFNKAISKMKQYDADFSLSIDEIPSEVKTAWMDVYMEKVNMQHERSTDIINESVDKTLINLENEMFENLNNIVDTNLLEQDFLYRSSDSCARAFLSKEFAHYNNREYNIIKEIFEEKIKNEPVVIEAINTLKERQELWNERINELNRWKKTNAPEFKWFAFYASRTFEKTMCKMFQDKNKEERNELFNELIKKESLFDDLKKDSLKEFEEYRQSIEKMTNEEFARELESNSNYTIWCLTEDAKENMIAKREMWDQCYLLEKVPVNRYKFEDYINAEFGLKSNFQYKPEVIENFQRYNEANQREIVKNTRNFALLLYSKINIDDFILKDVPAYTEDVKYTLNMLKYDMECQEQGYPSYYDLESKGLLHKLYAINPKGEFIDQVNQIHPDDVVFSSGENVVWNPEYAGVELSKEQLKKLSERWLKVESRNDSQNFFLELGNTSVKIENSKKPGWNPEKEDFYSAVKKIMKDDAKERENKMNKMGVKNSYMLKNEVDEMYSKRINNNRICKKMSDTILEKIGNMNSIKNKITEQRPIQELHQTHCKF